MKKKVLVVGTFRSGTNLAAHMLNEYYHSDAVFSEWFWKHGVPPTQIKCPLPKQVHILVLSKDPLKLNASLYRFWLEKRPELDAGDNISEFIRRRFIVYDNTGGNVRPRYYYSSPTEYWNQFYYSWLNWPEVQGRVHFLRLSDMLVDPGQHLGKFAQAAGLKQVDPGTVMLPTRPIGPTPEANKRDECFNLKPGDTEWITQHTDSEIAKALGYDLSV
ncbi:hypothetical protein K3556_15795 (plasmid) [Aliiroseovarius sp. M344]|uniref:hypothetical protein n=1 Tax=Aliiroseovarius sp. M344 TaxID=2867010 RepID=UPI0021AD9670|nr:hypothetical protein [Aliiroseovarius sp. M344]UWQ16045.1 hypothetical protein K3556_15795 [Aliiroseovarius sp. M344]